MIPARVNDWTEGKDWRDVTHSDGAQVFTLNLDEGFVFKGDVTHQTEKSEGEEEYYYYPRYDESVKRSLYIDNVLYTMSDAMIKMNSLSDLSEINKVAFGE